MRLIVILILVVGVSMLSYAVATNTLLRPTTSLTSHIEMGLTELYVSNLTISRDFYQKLVGLDKLTESQDEVTLGYQDRPVIRLIASSKSPAPRGSAGLYHTAIVFTSRAVLAQTLERILNQSPGFFVGSSDHLVSEAFYFVDPEGNGVELYFDKDPQTWQWHNGRIQMGSSYIDPYAYIASYGGVSADPSKKMGHVHLRVGSIDQAKLFYVDALGLTITAETPGAVFVSDGKYHHHLGLNTWESAGASVRPDSLGLKSVELKVAQQSDLKHLETRLKKQQLPYEATDTQLSLRDPWGNLIVVSVL